MKHLLLLSVAALALPTVVNAEAVLMIKTGLKGYGTAMTIQMKDMTTCRIALKNLKTTYKTTQWMHRSNNWRSKIN